MNALLSAVHGAERGWVWLYTAGMPAATADRRRNELDADAWAHATWADVEGLSRRTTVLQALAAFVLGTPSDVAWRVGLGRKGFSRPGLGEAAIAGLVVFGVALALPMAGFFALQGRDWVLDSGGSRWASFAFFLAAIAGTLLFAGFGVFDRRPKAGATLIALGGLCVGLSLWWSPAAVVLGSILCAAAVAAAWRMTSRPRP